MAEGLKIQVEADVKQATQALAQDLPKAVDKATGSFTGLSTQAANASRAIERSLQPALTKTSSAAKVLVPQLSKLGDTIETLRAKLGAKQSFLLTEKDPARVAALNKEMALLNAEILRIGNIGKAGFDGLGNAIQRVPPQLSAVATGAKSTFSVLRTAANILPGIGISGIVLALGNLVTGLFQTADAFSKAELDAIKFKNALADIKIASDNLKSFIDLQNTLADLDFRIAGGQGAAADINKFSKEISGNNKIIADYEKTLNALNPRLVQMNQQLEGFKTGAKNVRQLGVDFKETAAQQLALSGIDLNKITGDQLKKLSSTQQAFVSEYQQLTKVINDADKGRSEAVSKNSVLERRIQLKNVEEQRRLFEKAKSDYEQYVNDIISRGKSFASVLGSIFEVPQFTIFDSKGQQFAKALKLLNDFASASLKIKTPALDITPIGDRTIFTGEAVIEQWKGTGLSMAQMFSKEFEEYSKTNPIDFTLIAAVNNESTKKKVADLGKETAKIFQEALQTGLTQAFSGFGEGLGKALAGGSIGDAFNAFFSAIGSAIQSMGEQLIAIGIAAILAKEALATLFANPAVAIGAGIALIAAGAAMKSLLSGGIQGFAKGGIVSGPTLALIGEGAGTSRSNPEVVAPLDQLRSMLSDLGGSGTQRVIITGRLRGNDMLLQNARTSRTQRRTTGR